MPYTPLELANAFIQTGELQDALDALNQHLDANPIDDNSRRLRIQVRTRLRGQGHWQAALADTEQLSTQTAADRLTKIIILELVGDFETALNVAAELHAENPADEQIAERCFWLLMRQRQYSPAARLLAEMPHTWDWLTKAGDLATEDGHEEQAPAYYSEALKLLAAEFDLAGDTFARPIQANLLLSRAQAYATLNRFHEADADYAAAAAIMPDDPLIQFWHSFVLIELGQTGKAVELCRSALANASGWIRTNMVENLKALVDNPTFSPLGVLLDSQTP